MLRLVVAEAALAQGNAASAHTLMRVVSAHWPHSAAVWNVYARVAAALGGLRHNLKFFAPLRSKHPSCLPLALLTAHSHSLTVTPCRPCSQRPLFRCYSGGGFALIKEHFMLLCPIPLLQALEMWLHTPCLCVIYIVRLHPW